MAADLLTSLGLDRKAMERIDDDEKGVSSIHTLGGAQEMATVNESVLYSLILGSRKPEAKRFKKWVTSWVLPAIRKTGSYNGPAIDPMKVLNDSTLTTDSRRVPKHFHKRHDNVLRSFDNLDCSGEFNRLHFEAVTGTYTSGKVGNQESRLIHWSPGPKGSAECDHPIRWAALAGVGRITCSILSQ